MRSPAGGGDYTVHAVVGHRRRMGACICSICGASRAAADEWVEAFCDLVLEWQADRLGGGTGPDPLRRRTIPAQGACVSAAPSSHAEQFAARGDKAVRAQSMRGRMALDGLYVPARAPWLADFRAELLSFPAGRHDDQVDAIGLVGQLLQQMVAPAKPPPTVRPVRDRWDRLFAEDNRATNWKVV